MEFVSIVLDNKTEKLPTELRIWKINHYLCFSDFDRSKSLEIHLFTLQNLLLLLELPQRHWFYKYFANSRKKKAWNLFLKIRFPFPQKHTRPYYSSFKWHHSLDLWNKLKITKFKEYFSAGSFNYYCTVYSHELNVCDISNYIL